jgi:hypothetical protein
MRLSLVVLLASLVPLAGCDGGDSGAKKAPAPDPTVFPERPAEVTVTHVLIGMGTKVKPGRPVRTRDQAKYFAEELLKDLAKGTVTFESLVETWSDDVDPAGKPNSNNGKPGSYTFGRGMMMKSFENASYETPVGKLAPAPVETPYGFHIIRRDG